METALKLIRSTVHTVHRDDWPLLRSIFHAAANQVCFEAAWRPTQTMGWQEKLHISEGLILILPQLRGKEDIDLNILPYISVKVRKVKLEGIFIILTKFQ